MKAEMKVIMDMESISRLLMEISKNISVYSEPTLLDMAAKSTSETVHSAILGFLMNPNAHDVGAICLREFVKMIPEGFLGKFNPDTVAEVKTEKDFGPVIIKECPEYPTGGRADIYLEDDEGNVLVIENKLYAGDSECQLLRYHNSLTEAGKAHSFVYLSLYGKKPSDWSMGVGNPHIKNPLSADSVKTLSYYDIQEWLLIIKDFCSLEMKFNIEEYSRLISSLLMENQVNRKILSSGNNYRAAIEIAKNLEDARMMLKKEFMGLLRKHLTILCSESDNYMIEEYNSQKNSKLVGITINSKSSDLSFDVVIDWRLYISCNKSFSKIFDYDTWDYIEGKDAWNFHDCSEKVAKYLSSDENKEVVTSGVAQKIMNTISRIK